MLFVVGREPKRGTTVPSTDYFLVCGKVVDNDERTRERESEREREGETGGRGMDVFKMMGQRKGWFQ